MVIASRPVALSNKHEAKKHSNRAGTRETNSMSTEFAADEERTKATDGN